MEKAVKATDRICGTCKYWSPMTDYEGVCTSGLSGSIDVTEIRYVCDKYLHTFDGEDLEDYKD